MTSKQIALVQTPEMSVIEQVVLQGDLSKLNPDQRVLYYNKVCESVGLNPFTRPFDYINLSGKLTLYAKKDATEQLRKLNGISIEKLESKVIDDLYIVTAIAKDKTGRIDQATGAVTLGHLKGDAKANAIMKAETKAKRRVTLSIAGMGWVDESEAETIPGAQFVDVDLTTGEIKNPNAPQLQIAPAPKEEAAITPAQHEELYNLLELCAPDYKEKINEWLLSKKLNSLQQVPASMFESFKGKFTKAGLEYQQSLPVAEEVLEAQA